MRGRRYRKRLFFVALALLALLIVTQISGIAWCLPLSSSDPAILAQILNNRGSLQLATRQTEAALKTWQDAEKAYAQARDEMGMLGSKINQAQAWQGLGMFRRSQSLLEQVQQALFTQPNSQIKAIALRSLGLVWYAIGDLQNLQAAASSGFPLLSPA